MSHDELLQDSCRVALAGFLYDIGKFAEREKVEIPVFLQSKAIKLDDELLKIANQLATGLLDTDPDNNTQHFTLFEQIHIDEKQDRPKAKKAYCYPLAPLSPTSIFPIKTANADKPDYVKLWQSFETGLEQIPPSHQKSLPLWIDHFDSCLQTYTHNIPSTIAAGVSLYDHAKTATAIATALWRYQQTHTDSELSNKTEPKFLLIQGDFFGIQNFIFAQGGDSTKKAAKLLRGRSFYVSLITECAALAVLEALSLPSTSQIINAAGKFLIVAPNTQTTIDAVEKVQKTFNQWFLEQSYGQSGLGLAWQEACCNDFIAKGEEAGFKALMKKLHEKLECSKYQHFNLCGENPAKAVFSTYLDDFKKYGEPCSINSRVPATIKKTDDGKDVYYSDLANDQINIGKWLITKQRLIIATDKIKGLVSTEAKLFNFYIHFTEEEDRKGNFGKEVSDGIIRRAFDFSPPEGDKALWNGYARRNISGYVPYFKEEDEWQDWKYEGIDKDDLKGELEIDAPKTLNHLAREDLTKINNEKYGIKALAVLKGDIDNLGAIFQDGLEQPSFATMAVLSRQVNNFFAVYVPYLCQSKYKNTYIVFAGGDDFFLLGAWHKLMDLANELRKEFSRYVVNEQIHFSAGLTVMKPKIPIYQLAEIAEEALEQSKNYEGKNAVTCFKKTVSWNDFEKLTTERYDRLEALRKEYDLSRAYVYGLLRLTDMAADSDKPESWLWRSQLYYRTYRAIANKRNLEKEAKKRACEKLTHDIGKLGIEDFKDSYQITLHAHLYQNRKQS